jgi:hypothetical protein
MSGAVIDGVDVEALAAALRSCRGVDDLDGGRWGSVATYLPNRRQLKGIRVDDNRVTVQVRGTWGVAVNEVATLVRAAAAPFVCGHIVDLIVSDVSDPNPLRPHP